MTIELQSLAGSDVGFGFERHVRDEPGRYRLVCSYQYERVAGQAFAMAIQLVKVCAEQGPLDFAAALGALRETGDACAIGTSTGAVVAAARRRGIPVIRLLESANLFQLGWGSRQKRLQATVTGATGHIAVGIASDKELTKTLLKQAGLPVPAGTMLDANQGKGVTTICHTPDDVHAAFAHARQYGRNYRVLVTGDKVAAASWRRPAHVIGDGTLSIGQLVERENRNPACGEGHTDILTNIPMDDIALETLGRQALDAESVLPHQPAG